MSRSVIRGRAGLLLLLAPSCCSASAKPAAAPPPARVAAGQPAAPEPLPRYRSRRLGLSIPLPDGRRWRIDDHSRPELVATDAATGSRVAVAVLTSDGLVGRAQCEDAARARGLVPAGDLRPIEDDVEATQGGFDTRVVVALAPPPGPGAPLAGYVMAFGGRLHKCYAFVYSTEVAGASDEAALASRLAVARARVLGGLEIDAFDAVPRAPAGDPAGGGPP